MSAYFTVWAMGRLVNESSAELHWLCIVQARMTIFSDTKMVFAIDSVKLFWSTTTERGVSRQNGWSIRRIPN